MFRTQSVPLSSFEWGDFSGGLNTQAPADQLGPEFTPDCQNVYIGRGGEIISRPGYAKFDANSLAATIRRIVDFQYDSSQQLVVWAGTTMSKWANPNWTSLATGLASVNPAVVTFQNFLWFADGTNVKRYDGTNVRAWGIAAPASAPTLSAYTAGTKCNGVYKAKVTYVRGGTYSAESSAGPATAAISVSSDGITFASIPTSADGQVTARNVYLTEGNGEIFYYAFQIADNVTTSYNWDSADTALDTTRVAPTDHDVPASAKYAALYKNRIWMLDASSRTVRFSYLNQPDYFPAANSITLSTNDTDTGTGLKDLYDTLYAFTEDSIWAIHSDFTTSSVTRNLVTKKIGLVAPESLVSIGSHLLFLSDDGVYIFDGSTWDRISGDPATSDITSTLDALTLAQKQSAVGIHYPKLNWYILSIPGVAAYIYDLGRQCWTAQGASFAMSAMGLRETSAGSLALLGGVATYIWTMDSGLTDDGAAISWYWKTPWFDGGDGAIDKCARWAYLTAKSGSAGYPIQLRVYAEGSGTENELNTITLTASPVPPIRQDLYTNGRQFQLRFSGSAASGGPVTIEHVKAFYQMMRRL